MVCVTKEVINLNTEYFRALHAQIPKSLRALREAARLSQREIAEMLHINRSTYTYYEMGKVSPKLETLYFLAKLYRVPLEAFVDASYLPASLREQREPHQTGGIA